MFAEAPQRMTEAEFLAWDQTQEERFELVDGYPVSRHSRMMAGGTAAHSMLGVSVASILRQLTRGGACRAHGSDLKVRSPTGNIRYPDAFVECGPLDLRSVFGSGPVIVFEVLSPSNTPRDQARLLQDYQAVPTLEQIVFLEQAEPSGFGWTRNEGQWRLEEFEGWDAVIDLPAIQARVALAEIYEDILPRTGVAAG